MTNFPRPGLANIRAIPSGVIDGVQRDLRRDPNLRRKIVTKLTTANFRLELAILMGAQSAKRDNMSADDAYALGAYVIVGMLLATDETAILNQLLAGISDDTQKTNIYKEPNGIRDVIEPVA